MIWIEAGSEIKTAVERFREYIAGQTLATDIIVIDQLENHDFNEFVLDESLTVKIAVRKTNNQ